MDNSTNIYDREEYFDTEILRSNLKSKSINSGIIVLASQVVRYGLQLISTAILARLLSPRDYGLIAMVTVITSFIEMFKDLGLGTSTIQRQEINHNQVSNLFWINVASSSFVALILALFAPLISQFYHEPRLVNITLALAATLLISGLVVQHSAILRRQMRFMALANIQIGSIIVGIIIGISMAWYGAGYWALIGMSISMQLSRVVLSWYFCRWRPSLPIRKTGVLPLVKFGGHLTIGIIANYFSNNTDNILIGRFLGANMLGLYSKAYNIMMLPIRQIRVPLSNVAIPAFSSIANDPIRFKRYYAKFVKRLALITIPLMIFLLIHSYEIIYLLLGKQWLGAVGVFRIFCIIAIIEPLIGTKDLVMVALGQSKRYLVWSTINSFFKVLSFVIGLHWGIIGVATALALVSYLLMMPSLWYCLSKSPVSIKDLLSAISQPLFSGIIMGLIVTIAYPYIMDLSAIASIVCSFIICLFTYFTAMLLLPGGLAFMREIFSEIKSMIKKNDE